MIDRPDEIGPGSFCFRAYELSISCSNILNHLKLLRLSINSGCATHFGIISHSDIIQQLAVYTTLIKGCRVV